MRHIHIVGFKRAGTTLMQQLFHCFKDTWVSDAGGVHGWEVTAPLTEDVIVTKFSKDALHIDTLMSCNISPLYMVRDPRDTLASKFKGEEGYASNPEKLVKRIKAFNSYSGPIVMYENLVSDPNSVQQFLSECFELEIDVPFTDGYTRFAPGSGAKALNGIRPTDTDSIGRWKLPEHRARIEQLLEEYPEIQEFINEWY